jgi:hypothetical protein
MSMKNSIDTIGNRTHNVSTNCATVGVQAVALSFSRRPSYVDITHETHFRRGNNYESRIIPGKGEYIVLDGFVYC